MMFKLFEYAEGRYVNLYQITDIDTDYGDDLTIHLTDSSSFTVRGDYKKRLLDIIKDFTVRVNQ